MYTLIAWVRGLTHRLRETLGSKAEEAELDEEIRHHLALEEARLIRAGWDPKGARRQALRTFGSTLHVKEQARNEQGFRVVEMTLRDLRYAGRGLRKSPGFTAAVILTLALGIGATTAVFTLVDHILLRPLPYPASDQLVQIFQQNSPTNRWNLSVADVLGIQERQTSLESVAVLQRGSAAFTGFGQPEQVVAGRVTASWFQTLGVLPAEGRGFLPEDANQSAPSVVVLSSSFSNRVFGTEDPIGQSIALDGVSHTVVGVLGESVRSLAGYPADVWPALRLQTPTRRGPFGLRGIARLRAGSTLEDARIDLDQVSRDIFPRWADGFSDQTARLTPYPLQGVVVGDIGPNLWFVLGAVGGVLLIAIANVANLLLVRSSARRPEMALRSALGASRGQIARQLFTESLLLAFLGGVAAWLFAWGGLDAVKALGPSMPRLDEVALDGRILLVTATLTLGAAVVFGMTPLLIQMKASRSQGLGGVRGAVGGGATSGIFRSTLVAAEFAIAFPLLAGAMLLVGSLTQLQGVDPGYEPDGLVTAGVTLPAETYPDYQAIQQFWEEALRQLDERPAIQVAGVSTMLPPQGSGDSNNFDLLHRPVAQGDAEPVATWGSVSREFLSALDVPLLAGRMFDATDDGDARPVVVVSESWARKFAPDRDAVGVQFYSGGDRSQATTVVGVVGDIKLNGLEAADDAAVYEPFSQSQPRRANVLVRGMGAPEDAVAQLRSVISSMDPTLPLSDVQTMTERMSSAVAQPRLWSILLGCFSVLGLVLAAIGAYGVLSYYVGQQSRELGIRIALGASPVTVRNLVVRRGLGLASMGIGLGLVLSLASARWIRSLLFGVSPTDPRVLILVAAALLSVAVVACLVPALRATRIDPMRALRSD